MSTVGKDLEFTLDCEFDRAFEQAVDGAARQRVLEALTSWITFTARKKPSDDIPQRIEEMRKRFEVLAGSFTLRYLDGKVVVRVSGDAETTLRMLERGTDWFDPAGDATGLIAGAVLD